MTKEPENLVLKMLREMRSVLDEHTGEFAALHKKIDNRQETTSTGAGFAMHASIRTQVPEKEIADLKQRIDRIERSH